MGSLLGCFIQSPQCSKHRASEGSRHVAASGTSLRSLFGKTPRFAFPKPISNVGGWSGLLLLGLAALFALGFGLAVLLLAFGSRLAFGRVALGVLALGAGIPFGGVAIGG